MTVNPSAVGYHSAILTLNDPSEPGIEYQTMNTVIVPYEFNVGNNFSVALTGTIHRGQTDHYFFRVPAGVPALKVDMTGGGTAAGAGAIRFLRWHPWGLAIDSNAVSNCYNPNFGGCTSTGGALSRTTSNPQAGVWEVSVDAHRRSDSYPAAAPYTLTATILGATVSPNPDMIASATIGVPVARSYTMTNLFGAFTGRAVGSNMGSALRLTPTIANLAVRDAHGHGADGSVVASRDDREPGRSGSRPRSLRLQLHDRDLRPRRTGRGRRLRGVGDDRQPGSGRVEGRRRRLHVPAGSTTYKYIDVFFKTAALGVDLGHGRERAAPVRSVLDGRRAR